MDSEQTAYFLQSFRLYETFSKYYVIGRDKKRTFWRVLKIDRLECSELNINEDSTTYTENECSDLLKRLDEGNKITGGLKLVTTCYGIIGFVRFLEPYYMLLITKRKKIGEICGHKIYAITKSEMIPIPNPTVRTLMAYSKNENRYKKLLCTVDLTKDFFFSYSYNVMRSLQKNLNDYKTGQYVYKKRFVWNEHLTSEIRNSVSTIWTVALVHGFFTQVKLSIAGRNFKLTLIARRSRYFAGTRYLKRGVNEKGRVANDVETEQIVSVDAAEGCPMQITSVVQYRGSVPLFWSQNTVGFHKFRPEFSLPAEQDEYKATRRHFMDLVKRYGVPIIILSLLKTRGKKRAEKTLGATYAKAIASIIDSLPGKNDLRFCRWDLHTHMYSRRARDELQQLRDFAADALDLTGIFYCKVPPRLQQERVLNLSSFAKHKGDYSLEDLFNENEDLERKKVPDGNYGLRCTVSQKGILRTNCVDCLDRTNVAQYAYGLAALGRQLHVVGFIETPDIDFENPLAENLMRVYEAMGDTLALQYGGSPAHNKIFAEMRGEWKPATDYQDLITTVTRFYSNAFVDFEKQDAINVFLGYFHPQQGKPVLWELDSDQRYDVGRASFKRSLSESDILATNDSTLVSTDVMHHLPLSQEVQRSSMSLLEFMPDIQTQPLQDQEQGGSRSVSKVTPENSSNRMVPGFVEENKSLNSDEIYNTENIDRSYRLFDMDWQSSAGNSFHEADERCIQCANVVYQMKGGLLGGYSKSFAQWVFHGEALFKFPNYKGSSNCPNDFSS